MECDEPIGFTDEELHELNTAHVEHKSARGDIGRKRGGSRRAVTRASQPSGRQTIKRTEIPLGAASLSRPEQTNSSEKQKQFIDEVTTKRHTDVKETASDPPGNSDGTSPEKVVLDVKSCNVNSSTNPREIRDKEVERDLPSNKHDEGPLSSNPIPQISKLEELQRQQAALEEANRKRQEELSRDITEKFAQTSKQAQLLAKLKQDVASLERDISTDISLLRDRIDHCNRLYFDARKRYEAAEKEFVEAKLNLFNCKEKKDGLQEHLFMIIKLSEMKKAEKLEELNSKLEALNTR